MDKIGQISIVSILLLVDLEL